MKYLFLMLTFVFLLQSCGGDGETTESPVISVDANICLNQTSKNIALWNYMDDWYLWNESLDHSTVVDDFSSLESLMNNIKEHNPIDRFSAVVTKERFENEFLKAETFGYGMGAKIDELNHEIVVTWVYDVGSAEQIGLRRGDRIVAINEIDLHEIMKGEQFIWSEFWAEIDLTKNVSFTWRKLDGSVVTQSMVQSQASINTIFATKVIDSSVGKIGYLVYNSFIDPSSADLDQAFAYFKGEGVNELIVDLRYNHGGTSTMSNQLASQIGGDTLIGNIYNKPTNNANHQSNIELFNLNGAEHYLNMSRVVFVTTQESSSGSETLINSLKPYIDVKLVGQKTFGKPVGMRVSQLCDQVVLAITHQNHNADGFGDFFEGIPVDCPVVDSVASEWGDLKDPMLSEAVYLLENNQCFDNQDTESQPLKSLYPTYFNIQGSLDRFHAIEQNIF
jgi:C-terminal processing protease CtpA/Prc